MQVAAWAPSRPACLALARCTKPAKPAWWHRVSVPWASDDQPDEWVKRRSRRHARPRPPGRRQCAASASSGRQPWRAAAGHVRGDQCALISCWGSRPDLMTDDLLLPAACRPLHHAVHTLLRLCAARCACLACQRERASAYVYVRIWTCCYRTSTLRVALSISMTTRTGPAPVGRTAGGGSNRTVYHARIGPVNRYMHFYS